MPRHSVFALATLVVLGTSTSSWAQFSSQSNSNVQGSSSTELSERFSSDFGRFTTGSSASGVVGSGATQAGLTGVTTQQAGGINTQFGGIGGIGGLGGIGGFGGFGGIGGLGRGFGGLGGFGNQAGQQQGQTQIRTRMVLGFPSRPVAKAVVATRIQDRINRIARIDRAGPINVSMVDQTAVLEGVVGSESDRRIAAQVVMFEPGVRRVDNRLTIGETPEQLPETSGTPR